MKRIITAILTALVILPAVAQNKKSGRSFEIAKNLDIFNTIYRELDMFYVDTLEAEKLIRVGIDAMLNELDPYTEYYSEEEMDKLKMMTTGKYGGIGSIIRMRKDSTVIIMEPYAGMPAAEAGLKVGDVMLKIDDNDLKGKSVSEVSNMLRGEPGTTFLLRIQRQGEKKPRDFKITRQNIKIPAMPYYGMYEGIGYINLSDFTRDCSQDIRKAVISLKEKGAQGIVLDLRNNGGGLLVEAVDIINLFVPKGLDIVEMRGKARSSNNTYRTVSAPLDTVMPVAVLVNGNTASAAEIVAGSLQDLDRAVVLGSRSFGKGLVQSPRDLPYNGSVKLTTSKYYIPSGRCIQAIDYKHRRNAVDNSDGHVPDSLTNVFHTANGREVRDGGGIKPDVEVKHDTMPNIMFYLANDDVLVDFGTQYCKTHPTIPAVKDFTITDEDFEEFKKMVIESGFKYDRLSDKRLKDLKKMAEFEGYLEEAKEEFDALEKKLEHNLERDLNNFKKDIKKLMAQEIIKRYYFQAGVIEEQLKDDDDLMRAVEIIKNKDEYNKILGK
ncbi:MAG: S41 family peptidase [Bacteroides sp.]|nr:S41 family peptidase [Roseburia sp.]MCM1346028.1 S41 family peptidase [Bacteroides sp.]MCM1420189.1 S41 family peptidase [Bacteroides sp.]